MQYLYAFEKEKSELFQMYHFFVKSFMNLSFTQLRPSAGAGCSIGH